MSERGILAGLGTVDRPTVIVELQVPGEEFTLGQILRAGGERHITCEATVPTGEGSVPLFWVYGDDTDRFEASVEAHDAVEGLGRIDEFEDRTLYALDWRASEDSLLTAIADHHAQLLSASRTGGFWDLELRFPSHEALSAFRADAEANGISLSVQRRYNPSGPDAERPYGLTDSQRETLELAVARGYYAVPREISALELGEELGISDQAVTERLRRAIGTLVSNTLSTTDD